MYQRCKTYKYLEARPNNWRRQLRTPTPNPPMKHSGKTPKSCTPTQTRHLPAIKGVNSEQDLLSSSLSSQLIDRNP